MNSKQLGLETKSRMISFRSTDWSLEQYHQDRACQIGIRRLKTESWEVPLFKKEWWESKEETDKAKKKVCSNRNQDRTFHKERKSTVSNLEETWWLRMLWIFKNSLVTLEILVNWWLWPSSNSIQSINEMRNEGSEHFNCSMKTLAMKGKEDPLRYLWGHNIFFMRSERKVVQ
jgi:hypothetical protein